MFSALVTTVVLAGSIAMPVHTDNTWAANDWQELKDHYAVCQVESLSALEYYECADRWYILATTNTQKA